MKTIGADNARTHFSALLKEVANGTSIVITKHGTPVAQLVPIRDDIADAVAAIEEWRHYRAEHNIVLGDEITIRELIEEGRM